MSTHPHDPAARPGGGEPDGVPPAAPAPPAADPPAPDPLGAAPLALDPPAADPPVLDPPAADPPGGARPGPGGRFGARMRAAGRWLRAHAGHTLVVAVAAAVAGALVPPGVEALRQAFEEPPPGCPGAGCDGKSPAAQCSADAVTWEPKAGNPVRIQLRHSASCGAVWGRIVNGEPGDTVTIRVRGGSSRSAVINFGHDKYTDMATVGRTFRVRVCAVPSTAAHRVGKWVTYCFEGTDRSDWE
ncbi:MULTISPECIES: DUF2690 domain-containing protein [Streptomyces]|uniref:DUF2690 domain-containing protein n=1 Tax=Streptomyces ramulosus TaxID=47762 RepID=A0ABW1FNE4_9ACTN